MLGLGIGDTARLTQLSVRQVDYWAELGIVQCTQDEHGHRLFSGINIFEILLARQLRDHGLSLRDIAACMEVVRQCLGPEWRQRIQADFEKALFVSDGASLFRVVQEPEAIRLLREGYRLFAVPVLDVLLRAAELVRRFDGADRDPVARLGVA